MSPDGNMNMAQYMVNQLDASSHDKVTYTVEEHFQIPSPSAQYKGNHTIKTQEQEHKARPTALLRSRAPYKADEAGPVNMNPRHILLLNLLAALRNPSGRKKTPRDDDKKAPIHPDYLIFHMP
ncbi:hypothetical protein E4U58_003004 [Claviceps cyperi]|nr:hypothetical protein E4U58_003004 [Claviceps cyperi]